MAMNLIQTSWIKFISFFHPFYGSDPPVRHTESNRYMATTDPQVAPPLPPPPPAYIPAAAAQPGLADLPLPPLPFIYPSQISLPAYASRETLPVYTRYPQPPTPEPGRIQTIMIWISSRRVDAQSRPSTPYNSTRSSSTALAGRLRRSELVQSTVKGRYVVTVMGICFIIGIALLMKKAHKAGNK
ncbi:hypothetical protein CVT24_008742 [Panaeolus cyanescens]|uniref:Uncharacterized protein n=1 Tax=Panaeolus cyanescens TaxID=181874 RepID=A0A409VB14_9AGAR|nr:hypothetical protein CVT24_008742 [Panaeolus cyanescens]